MICPKEQLKFLGGWGSVAVRMTINGPHVVSDHTFHNIIRLGNLCIQDTHQNHKVNTIKFFGSV